VLYAPGATLRGTASFQRPAITPQARPPADGSGSTGPVRRAGERTIDDFGVTSASEVDQPLAKVSVSFGSS